MECDDGTKDTPINPRKKIRITENIESEQLHAEVNPSTPTADDTPTKTVTAETEHSETPEKKNITFSPKLKLCNVTKMILPEVDGNVDVLDERCVDIWLKKHFPNEEFSTERDKIHRFLSQLLKKSNALKMFSAYFHGNKPTTKREAINAIADFVVGLYG